MPNLGWEDRNENARLQISLDQSGRKALFEGCPNETKSLTAKELTLCYLAYQYGCFFDAMGQKKHFFEEKNLRRLTDLVFVLRLSEQEQNSDGGYSKLMSYIYNHFKSFALTDSEADIFSDWLERTVDRRGEEIVTYIRNERNKLPWADKNDSSGEWNGYSYGELIHSLYCATRIGSEGKTIFSKGMVHCILASYSIVLPRLVENGQIDEMRDKIKNVLGTSISGPWADTIFPTIFVSARENDSGIPRPNMWGKLGKFDIGCQLSAVLRIKCLPPSVHVIGDRMETNDAETKRFIQALELLGMFFTNIQLDNHTHNYALRWKHDVTECVLTTDANFACFNILNFVINSFFWEDYFDQFHTMLPEILRRREVSGALQSVAGYRAEEKKVEEAELAVKQAQQKITELGNTSGRAQEVSEAEKNVRAARAKAVNLAEGVMEDLKKDADMAELMAAVEWHSLKEEYKAWAKKYGSCALPFQHFDMMYNLLKRQRDGYVHGVKAEAMPKDFLAGRETSLMECRHASYRKKVEKITRALMLFRERYSSMACRVLGIDACSQEIGCRPEVLAGAFRTLGEHTCLREISGQQSAVPRLRKTYHVGEDFLDLTDGLRAIDEAVHFLDLDCGDRLGHALALCLNPIEWYAAKRMQISLSVQAYIDNVVWLYHAIQKYHIPHQEYIIHFLEKEFKYYFNRVYLSNIRENELDSMMCAAVDYYQGDREAYRYRRHTCDFSIELYSYSWMLRGDHPALYQEGYFKKNAFPLDEWESHGINMRYPHNVGIRYIPECSLLYYLYHYNEAVKYAGTEIINIVARPDYIEALTAVQKALQFEIAQRGIAVESNPTSNAKISTFREYSKHPIVALYNKGLFHSEEELRRCAQVQVSINTDDSGVFFTSLESEYAVMARALETIVDHEGNRQFYKWEVYDWLDQVRRMGNEQGFASAALPP